MLVALALALHIGGVGHPPGDVFGERSWPLVQTWPSAGAVWAVAWSWTLCATLCASSQHFT